MVRRDDKGQTIPEFCPKCGGEIVVKIKGEPVYICNKCGKYYGTLPFPYKNENIDWIYVASRAATDREMSNCLLNEERHYPDFLIPIVDELLNDTKECFKSWRDGAYYSGEFLLKDFELRDNKYLKRITIKFSVLEYVDASDIKKYKCSYVSSKINSDGKLQNPFFLVNIPSGGDGQIYWDKVRFILSHEVEHMFDDWTRQRNGYPEIGLDSYVKSNYAFFENNINSDNDLYRKVAMLSYLQFRTEQNAFVTQTFCELASLGTTDDNYRQTLKQTVGYRNYNRIQTEIIPSIRCASQKDIEKLMLDLADNQSENLCFPAIRQNINVETYRNMLILYAETIAKKFFKRFYGIVSLYVDKWKETHPVPPIIPGNLLV